ncbi:MAG: Uma2 family endonuclease [Caldilineaceae bacterium]|nr:Uma2 family endonuclease [Caldilineaceae bacterium]HRJ41191.1 Uma2 family endonuclease [Caldilineaceae bacterium]
MSTPTAYAPPPVREQPTWEIAELFPSQGHWSEGDYLALETNRLVEFSNGYIEVLPMPSISHQFISLYLYRLLYNFVSSLALGTVLTAPAKVRLWRGKYREPDLFLLLAQSARRIHEQYVDGADLVMEVVSGGARDRDRDWIEKRQEYAQAGIPEYWIVDPETETVTVLALEGGEYAEYGEFCRGETATSKLLPGFVVLVDDVFDAQ